MDFLKLKIPPLFVLLLCASLTWWLSDSGENALSLMSFGVVFGLLLGLLAGLVCFLGVWEFKSSRTTVNPMTPKSSSSLVQSGIYKYTRNPMYLGFAMFLVACAFVLGSFKALLATPLFVVYITTFQIKPEEAALEQLFGGSYVEYKTRVRRWL
ncbi:methyltransferase family protein [Shewanella maritima]|uniref:methyltransferase family protein n=1 Tax=Shewanella maritima TaxID=2520507 RepID=UPI0037370187